MLKKILYYTQRTLWSAAIFLVPSLIVYIYIRLSIEIPKGVSVAFLYLASIVSILLIAWKSSRNLFALSLGFLITSVSYPIEVWFMGGHLWRDLNSGFGGANFAIAICGVFFAFPFTIAAFIPGIIAWYRRKHNC